MWNRSAGNPAGVRGRTEATRGETSHDETGHKGESHATSRGSQRVARPLMCERDHAACSSPSQLRAQSSHTTEPREEQQKY